MSNKDDNFDEFDELDELDEFDEFDLDEDDLDFSEEDIDEDLDLDFEEASKEASTSTESDEDLDDDLSDIDLNDEDLELDEDLDDIDLDEDLSEIEESKSKDDEDLSEIDLDDEDELEDINLDDELEDDELEDDELEDDELEDDELEDDELEDDELEDIDLEDDLEVEDLPLNKNKEMDGQKMTVDNEIEELKEAPKKSGKTLLTVAITAVAASVLGGGYYAHSKGMLDEFIGSSDDNLEAPVPMETERSKNDNKKLNKTLKLMEDRMKVLEDENIALRKKEAVQNEDMQDFKETLDVVKANQSSKGKKSLSSFEIQKIVDIVENKTAGKISTMENKLASFEETVEKQDEKIKKAIKVSLNAWKEAKEVKKIQVSTAESMSKQMEMIQSLTTKIENNEVPVSNDVLDKISTLENQVKILGSQEKTQQKMGKVTIPVEVEIKKSAAYNSNVESSTSRENKVVVETVYYSVVGLTDNAIYLRDIDNTNKIEDYRVGDHLDGYGIILSISKDGKIRTDNGVVKTK